MARALLFQGDCHVLMRAVPDGSVGMVLSDWPYGMTANAWDKRLDLDRVWPELWRALKPDGVIALFARCPYDKVLGAHGLKTLRYEYVWLKPQGTNFMDAKRMPLKRTENVLIFCRVAPPYFPEKEPGRPYVQRRKEDPVVNLGNRKRRTAETVNDGFRWPTNVLEYAAERGLHPTQKPVGLCARLIRTHSGPGDLILDNCAGSGTTAVAALREGRRFLGFESDPAHHATAMRRIAAELEVTDDAGG
jgi:site-specific DNA-methyltransferase (adenine-specific)